MTAKETPTSVAAGTQPQRSVDSQSVTSMTTGDNIETPVGYAWLPLVHSADRLVMEVRRKALENLIIFLQSTEQEFSLPVAAQLIDGYLSAQQPSTSAKVTEQKVSFVKF